MARKQPEQALQIAVVEHLKLRGVPGLVWLHPANGGARSAREGAMFKKMGVRAGASDLLLFHNERFYALELKVPGGRPTSEQLKFQSDMQAAGAFTGIGEGIDRALGCLSMWGLLRGNAG